MQNEIKKMTQLLDEKGKIAQPGYATKMMYEYNRENIKASPFAKKEWDFYQIITGDYVLKFTIGNISYVADFSAELFNVKTKELYSFSRMRMLPFESIKMPLSPEPESIIKVEGKDYEMFFEVKDTYRRFFLKATDEKIGAIDIDVYLNNDVTNEKMVIATPFEKKGKFYLNCKENYFGGKGRAWFGDKCLDIDESATATLDWGRGVWPFSQEWFWGNGAAYVDGNKFGFNIGWGFGDLKNATENMFFWNGKAHKLGKLDVEVDTNDYFKPWKFKDEDGKFEFTLTPLYDKLADTKIAFIHMYCHQLFGVYSGFIVLPDGKKVEINNMLAFCEHAMNKW
ncbi:MAG: DUF2804 domain-containing protein [Clostridia bacterium]|nr:DUF2804 domain-containing protein [Clostridia bacterium]